jgi:CheY-like chemotaxis protein
MLIPRHGNVLWKTEKEHYPVTVDRKVNGSEKARAAGLPVVQLFVTAGLPLRTEGFFSDRRRLYSCRHNHEIRITMTVNSEKPRILIVDDTPHIRDLIKLFYDDYDFDLIEAVNGQDAVEMARTCTPDLILLDIQMPVMNGYEAAVILKNDRALKNIPLLVMTGQAFVDVKERISGMYNGYLSKPFQQEDLIEATMQCLPDLMPQPPVDAHTKSGSPVNHDRLMQVY